MSWCKEKYKSLKEGNIKSLSPKVSILKIK